MLVRRLRVRRPEIDEAIFARVSDRWFDRTGSEDPEYVAGMRAAGVAALDYVLVGIERSGGSLERVPAAALEQARRAARAGVGLDTVLRRYLAGYAVLEGFVMHEAGHDERDLIGPTQANALRDVLQRMSPLVDRLITAVSSAYSKEVQRAGDAALAGEDSHISGLRKKGTDRVGSSDGSVVAGRVGVTRREHTSQRARILDALVAAVGERGYAGASVALVVARAKVSPRTFYELFEGQKACFLEVMDDQTDRARALVVHAFERESSWQDGLRAALTSLLVFLDSEPTVARVWLVEILAAGSWALERRARNLSQLTSLIVAAWAVPEGWQPPPLAAESVMTSVLGVLHNHLVTGSSEPLISLLGPLMGIITRPYLDHESVTQEIARGATLAAEIQAGREWPMPSSVATPIEIPALVAHPSAHRARGCLLYIAKNPEASNRQIAAGIGAAHDSQISTLLSRLFCENLLDKHSRGPGKRNAWRLTARGAELARLLETRSNGGTTPIPSETVPQSSLGEKSGRA